MANIKLGQKNIKSILSELRNELLKVYKDRLVSLIFYGSYARGEAGEGSDIDVAVVLSGEVYPGMEIDNMLNLITDLNLKYNALISVYPVSKDALCNVKSPLLLNVQREGINL
ncbi:MAG: nucleotidyltransferase domain-containing protein [Deltaproteobacteria bacterium]|nr:nucleotidyltransferase domain-containing protein [Deltaproteobacteria bacterium]